MNQDGKKSIRVFELKEGGYTMENLKQKLLEQIEKLTPLQQKQVLDFALELSGELSKRYPGEKLLELVGTISPEDLEIMKQAIEEGCGMASLAQGQHTKKH